MPRWLAIRFCHVDYAFYQGIARFANTFCDQVLVEWVVMADGNRILLRMLRAQHNLSQEQFARQLGVSRSLVSMWEAGRAHVDASVLEKLALLFEDYDQIRALVEGQVSADLGTRPAAVVSPTLRGGQENRGRSAGEPGSGVSEQVKAFTPASSAAREGGAGAVMVSGPSFPVSYEPIGIPYAGLVPASSEWGDPLAAEEPVEVDAKFVKKGRFACRVVGDSCYPALRQGDLTIWEVDPSPKYGLIVLAQRKGDHGCTVKQLVYDSMARRDRLVPVNPAYDSPPDGEGWGVIARLVGVVREGEVERSWYSASGMRPKYLTGELDED